MVRATSANLTFRTDPRSVRALARTAGSRLAVAGQVVTDRAMP